MESNEWKLLDYPAEKHVLKYPCCDEPYPDLTYTIHVKRIAVFYSFILVVPCVLLSLLTLVSFWLPPESPAKVLLGRSGSNDKFTLCLYLNFFLPDELEEAYKHLFTGSLLKLNAYRRDTIRSNPIFNRVGVR